MFSLVRIMLLYGCSFLGFFRLGISYRSIVSAERLPEKKEQSYVWQNAGWELKWSEMRNTRIREILMAGYGMS